MKKMHLLALMLLAAGSLVLWLSSGPFGKQLAQQHSATTIEIPTSTASPGTGPTPSGDEAIDPTGRASVPPAPSVATATTSVAAVVADRDGRPISDAVISVQVDEEVSTDKADRHGFVECILGPETAGRVQVTVGAQGFATISRVTRVQERRQSHLGTIRLDPDAGISGRVLDELGVPLASAIVYLERDADPMKAQQLFGRQFPPPSASGRQLGSHLKYRLPAEVQRVETDGAGRYAFTGLSEGWVRVWAVAPGSMAAFTEPIELHSRSQAVAGDLVVERLAAARIAKGRLLAPDGTPAAGARITLAEVAWLPLTGARSDADGHFVLPLTAGEIYDLVADDPSGRWCPIVLRAVAAGTLGLEVRFPTCAPTALVVRDDTHRPITHFGYDVNDESGENRPWQFEPVHHADGVTRLTVPPGPFTVSVNAPGFEGASSAAFDFQHPPPEIVVVLRSLANLRGRVSAPGGPVAGASIELRPDAPEGLRLALDLQCVVPEELPASSRPPTQRTSSDSEGRFGLYLEQDQPYSVRVSADGFAPAVVRGLRPGAPEVVIQLTPGGGIEGRVVDSDDSPRAGLVVAATSGDGHVAAGRTDGNGAFWLEHLAPGTQWLAILADEPARSGPDVRDSRPAGGSDEPEAGFVCTVREGGRTPVLLKVSSQPPPSVEGRIQLHGLQASEWSMEGWDARIYPESSGPDQAQPTRIDAEGRFTFRLGSAGDYRLLLTGQLPSGAKIFVLDNLHIDTEKFVWNELLSLGNLEVALASPSPWLANYRIVCATELGEGLRAIVNVEPSSSAELPPNTVVAGQAKLLREFRFRTFPTEVGLRSLAEGYVKSGGTTTFEVP